MNRAMKKKANRPRRKSLVCVDCKRRERHVTAHNDICGRCWKCHESFPCYLDE